jgi:hypothetical protein
MRLLYQPGKISLTAAFKHLVEVVYLKYKIGHSKIRSFFALEAASSCCLGSGPPRDLDIRMRVAIVLLALLPASMSSGWAQSLDAKALSKKSDAPVARPKDRAGMKPCPEYGAGFYRLEGSGTCTRIGGSIGAEGGAPGGRR